MAKNLIDIVNQVKLDLGVNCEVSAELYKLLVYDTGSFFVSHRDTEKADGMFATLIIVLPSVYTGGELVVRHQQEEVKLDLCSQEAEEICFAAFYADCIHEVLPVSDGCRLTLVYNLLRTDKKIPLPIPPNYYQPQQKVAALLNKWVQNLDAKNDEDDTPKKLIFLLEHEYSIAELKFEALKNKDAASAEVLLSASKQANCDLYLALVSIEESGSAEYIGGGGHYNYWHDRDDDDDDYEIGEVFDQSETISEWRSPDGSQPELPPLPFNAEEFCPPEDFENMDPDDIEFQEATGNAGASFERMYHCAALVLWPRTHYLTIINQAGFESALSVLNDLSQQWQETKNEQIKQQGLTLATYIIRDWLPQHCNQSNRYGNSPNLSNFLKCLCRLGDVALIKRVWAIIAENGIYRTQDSLALAQSSALMSWPDVVKYTTAAMTMSAIQNQEACVVLLVALCKNKAQSKRIQLCDAARALFEALPGDSQRFPELLSWQHERMALTASDVADIVVVFCLIDSGLAEEMLDYMLTWPSIYGVDQILLPVSLQIAESTLNIEFPAVVRLRQIVIAHLQKRLAEQLAPPRDWRREDKQSKK